MINSLAGTLMKMIYSQSKINSIRIYGAKSNLIQDELIPPLTFTKNKSTIRKYT